MAFGDFLLIVSFDLSKKEELKTEPCIEVEFRVDNDAKYQNACLGKMIDSGTQKELYWYGLTSDGMEAYDYYSIEHFINAKVFNGKSIKEIWELISIISVDASDVKEQILFYKSNT